VELKNGRVCGYGVTAVPLVPGPFGKGLKAPEDVDAVGCDVVISERRFGIGRGVGSRRGGSQA